jgi:tetratricopeptide (TPR) repeat protein
VDALSGRPNVNPDLIAGYLEAAEELDEAAEAYARAVSTRLEQGEFSAAVDAASGWARVLRRLRVPRDAVGWVQVRMAWAQCQTGLGGLRAAWRHSTNAVRMAEHLDPLIYIEALRVQGTALHLFEGPSAAWSAYWEALRVSRQRSPAVIDAKLAERAGACQLELGHLDEAERLLRQSLVQLEEAESPNQGTVYHLLATVALHRDDLRAAQRLAETALGCHEAAGARIGMLHAQRVLGEIARAEGERDAAETAFRAAHRLAEATGATELPLLMCNVAVLLVERGRCLEGIELIGRAIRRAQASEYRLAEAVALLCHVYADAHLHRWNLIEDAWSVIEFIVTAGYTAPDVAALALGVAQRAVSAGRPDDARRFRHLALAQLEGLGRLEEAEALRSLHGHVA